MFDHDMSPESENLQNALLSVKYPSLRQNIEVSTPSLFDRLFTFFGWN